MALAQSHRMEPHKTTNPFNLSHLSKLATPTTIKTSKNWVLPPRPRPGRKPNHLTKNSNTSSSTTASATSNSSVSFSSINPSLSSNNNNTSEKPKKAYKKKNQKQLLQQQQQNLNVLQAQVKAQNIQFNSPVELELKRVNDENKLLKLEVSKLVSDLKVLQHQSDDSDLHKKRHHVEMDLISSDESLLDQLIENVSDDDICSLISTPSLISNNSSIMSHSTNSLSSIQEDEILKLDDFLNVSYFDNSNSISIKPGLHSPFSTQTSGITVNPLKSNGLKSPMLSPPSLPMNVMDDEIDFQFKFLEQENTLAGNENFESFFEIPSIETDDININWDLK